MELQRDCLLKSKRWLSCLILRFKTFNGLVFSQENVKMPQIKPKIERVGVVVRGGAVLWW